MAQYQRSADAECWLALMLALMALPASLQGSERRALVGACQGGAAARAARRPGSSRGGGRRRRAAPRRAGGAPGGVRAVAARQPPAAGGAGHGGAAAGQLPLWPHLHQQARDGGGLPGARPVCVQQVRGAGLGRVGGRRAWAGVPAASGTTRAGMRVGAGVHTSPRQRRRQRPALARLPPPMRPAAPCAPAARWTWTGCAPACWRSCTAWTSASSTAASRCGLRPDAATAAVLELRRAARGLPRRCCCCLPDAV